MAEAIARAREVHVGWCAARNITHAGAVGYFALQAAEAGMAGIVMSASGPMMGRTMAPRYRACRAIRSRSPFRPGAGRPSCSTCRPRMSQWGK
jgi:hypothetical protein